MHYRLPYGCDPAQVTSLAETKHHCLLHHCEQNGSLICPPVESSSCILPLDIPDKYVVMSMPMQCCASSAISRAILPATAQAGRFLPSSWPRYACDAGARTALLPKQGIMSGAARALAWAISLPFLVRFFAVDRIPCPAVQEGTGSLPP